MATLPPRFGPENKQHLVRNALQDLEADLVECGSAASLDTLNRALTHWSLEALLPQ